MKKKKRPLERTVREKITDRLDELKYRHPIWWESIVGHHRQRSGLPDLRVVFYGLSLDLEVKRDAAESATPAQSKCLSELRWAAGEAGVIWSVDQLETLLRQLLRLAKQFSYCGSCHAPVPKNAAGRHRPCRRCCNVGDWHHAREEL